MIDNRSRVKLIKLLSDVARNQLTAAALDEEYSKLSDPEKVLIASSVINDTNEAKQLIKSKIQARIEPEAEAMADAFIDFISKESQAAQLTRLIFTNLIKDRN